MVDEYQCSQWRRELDAQRTQYVNLKYKFDDLEYKHRIAVQAKLEALNKIQEANNALYWTSQEVDRLNYEKNEASRKVDQVSNSIRELESNMASTQGSATL